MKPISRQPGKPHALETRVRVLALPDAGMTAEAISVAVGAHVDTVVAG